LARAIADYPIRACWFMTTLHHPTGATVPAERKRELVRLLAGHDVALIEDDAYAELQFSPTPSLPAKAFDTKGFVLHCGSFSKCLAPGYRLGWVAAGRFTKEVARLKIECSGAAVTTHTLSGCGNYWRTSSPRRWTPCTGISLRGIESLGPREAIFYGSNARRQWTRSMFIAAR
jgi:hypothetical protein